MIKLKLMTIAVDDWEKLRTERDDLCAKLEAAKKSIKVKDLANQTLGRYFRETQQERDELRRQVESLTKVKHEFHETMIMYKKACSDLIELKEKQYAKIDEIESQNAALHGAIQSILDIVDLSYGCADGYGYAERLNEAKIYARQALTASGDNRCVRIEEAAKAVKSEMQNIDNCNIPGPGSRLGRAINSLLAAALGGGEK